MLIDDIIVDEGEVRAGAPRQMHQRRLIDRDVLKAAFPDHAEAVGRAQMSGTSERDWNYWAEYRPIGSEEIVVIESWYLPIGRKGAKGYVPGRHTIIIDGHDLLDEEWHKAYFPFARFAWIERTKGWYPHQPS